MSSPAPKSPEFSDKNRKYDRQIRLWGEHGQSLLELSKVCLINATALGAEVLKCIVLPGIGGFTIVDGCVVTEEDIGCNFFLDASCLGQSRAKSCTQLLQELNQDVNGDYVDESIEQLLQNNPEFLKQFDVVVATALSERTIITLSQKLWELNIPCIMCRSIGMIGTIRVQIKEHCVIETHPDDKKPDLRLEHPFTGLKDYMNTTVITPKVPWLVILYKFLENWRFQNEGRVPTTYKEKSQFRDTIREAMLLANEENYEEAIKAVNSSFGSGKADSNLCQIFDSSSCTNLNKHSNEFWILVRAVRDFVQLEGNGCLPLQGVLPDMTADTASYINLQNVYRQQAMHDADIVFRRAQQILKELEMSSDLITEKDAKLFCREVSSISVVRGTKIADEYDRGYKATNIATGLELDENLMGFYIALRAMEKFQMEKGCMPGENQVETDTAWLKSHSNKLLAEWGITIPFNDDLVHEICRYGGAEIHSVSAFIGGCVAQEVIKLVTKQYKPVGNTFIYNAITSETATFEL